MVRFACPEPSASASTLDGPSQSRPSPHPRLKKSIKKSHKPRELDRIKVKFTGPLPRRTIYVGNLVPGIRTEVLAGVFEKFGCTESIIVRCSSGLFVNRIDVPDSSLKTNDGFYATIRYRRPESAKDALLLNGLKIKGVSLSDRTLVVSFSPADLPEAKRKLQERFTSAKSPTRPLTRADTEITLDQTFENRHLICGVSFFKTIL